VNPLCVALVHRDSPRLNGARSIGAWSYAVPEFTWTHFPVGKGFHLERGAFLDYDLIVYEDGKIRGEFTGDGPPIAYMIGDSTLSDEHYQVRRDQAVQCNLLLVDWDRLERFADLGVPTRRLSYCVNDRLMRPDLAMGKDVCVGSFQGGTPERRELEDQLRDLCNEYGYTFEAGNYAGQDYAMMLARSKIVVNQARNPQTRSHRIFDAMACRSCVVALDTPDVSGEERQTGTHYVECERLDLLIRAVPYLLNTGTWEDFAGAGYVLVQECHTWAVRARELRVMLAEELNL
jgi:hypothetical protein